MIKSIKMLSAAMMVTALMASSAFSGEYDTNKTITGLALRGYDPVAYFTENKPVPGDFSIMAVYNDATYRFASEEHKKMFEADPNPRFRLAAIEAALNLSTETAGEKTDK